jgi:hypothetical protein
MDWVWRSIRGDAIRQVLRGPAALTIEGAKISPIREIFKSSRCLYGDSVTVTKPDPELEKKSGRTPAVAAGAYVSAAAGVVLAGLLCFALFRSGIFDTSTSGEGISREKTARSNANAPEEGISGLSPLTAEGGNEAKQVDPKQVQGDAQAKAEIAAKETAAQEAAQLAAKREADELEAKKRQLEAAAAEQAAARELANQQASLEASRRRAQEEEAERKRLALEAEAAKPKARPAYQGPTSGVIVWEGEVTGYALVTISGNESDSGRIVSGALPGTSIIVTPSDGKHVRIAASPAPSNSFQRMAFGVNGKGPTQVKILWSIP